MSEGVGLSGWFILEALGHRRFGGLVQEVTLAGFGMLRLDVYQGEQVVLTQFYPPSSIYCLTPCTEEMARREAGYSVPAPALLESRPPREYDERDDYDDEDDFSPDSDDAPF
jgi:hypothetical protein